MACYCDVTAHGARQTARDCQAQSCSLVTAGMTLFGLRKLGEDGGAFLLGQPDPCVFYTDLKTLVFHIHVHGYEDTALVCKFYRVANQVDQDLPDTRIITHQFDRHIGGDVACNVDPLVKRMGRHQFAHLFNQGGDAKRFFTQINFTGFNFGEVENIVDDRQQRFCGALHRTRVGALCGREFRFQQKADHAQNTVHWCTDFMAHGGQKLALGPVGAFCLLQRLRQMFFCFLPVRNVTPDGLDFTQSAVIIPDGEIFPDKPARPADCHDALIVAHPVGRQGEPGKRTQHARRFPVRQGRGERRAKRFVPAERERVTKNLVNECQAAFKVFSQDDVTLIGHKITVTLFAFLQLPIGVPQMFQLNMQVLDFRRLLPRPPLEEKHCQAATHRQGQQIKKDRNRLQQGPLRQKAREKHISRDLEGGDLRNGYLFIKSRFIPRIVRRPPQGQRRSGCDMRGLRPRAAGKWFRPHQGRPGSVPHE